MSLGSEGGELERIASFTHDSGGTETLFAYQPAPAEVIRSGEAMANRLYGFIDTRSPRTPYICVWRDPEPSRFRAGPDSGPPGKILMACNFGTEPWSPPANLVEHASQASQRDQAQVTMGWEGVDGDYRLVRLEIAIGNLAAGRDFRSVWFDDEIQQIVLDRCQIEFPSSPVDDLRFLVSARLPRRYNRHEPPKEPTVAFIMAGIAPPIPDWVLY